MSNIYVDKNKIDLLANAISAKSGESLTLTLDEMIEAVDGIENGGGGITPSGNIDITSIGVTDVTNYATATVPQSYYELITDHYFETVDGVRKFKVRAELDDRYNGGFIFLSPYESKLGAQTIFDAIGTGTSITPTESSQTIGRVNIPTVLEGVVTINAISSDYIGSGIARLGNNNIHQSGDTVYTDAGYYEQVSGITLSAGSATPASSITGSSATVSTGTNTLTLSKTVSNTPQVSAGYISSGTAGNSDVSLTASVTVNPTLTASGATVTVPAGYYTSQTTKSVDTMTLPTSAASTATSGYTSKATIGRSTSNQYINIPPGYNNAGAYYAISAVANGSATGPSSLSGTSATVSTGTNTVTFTKTGVTTTPTVSAGYISSATASTATVSLTANINTRSSSDLTASNLTVTAPSGYYANAATKTLSDVNLTAGNIKKDVTIFGTTGTYEGSGGGDGGTSMQIATATTTLSSAAQIIAFENLLGEPTSFVILCTEDLSVGSNIKIASVVYDGTNIIGQAITNTSNSNVAYIAGGFYYNYNLSTLEVIYNDGSGVNFQPKTYSIIYTYGGSSSNIGTADVQVGSGATSITFTGLEDEPEYFSCIFKSNFGTSSGYQRTIAAVYNGSSTYGMEMDSSAKASTVHWSYSYNNGSLTITSQGTNAGGYFHQPGYYQLTYAIGGDSSLQKKTVTPTSSDQTITADTAQGYTALSQVKVEGVTCSNLTAGNIKSGVTVKIGTSTDDDSVTSVTGTYDAGGGSSIQYDTKTVTASNYPVSLSFTSMKGEPKFFVVRLNAQVSSSGNTTYYYIVDITSNGTTTHGNCFRIGSTRRVDNITSGYSWSYSGSTLTITSSAASRSASPGAFYSGSYELMYAY